MNLTMRVVKALELLMLVVCVLVITCMQITANTTVSQDSLENKGSSGPATIAVLSHTDFLPDATGVYDRRSTFGRDKSPGFIANNDQRTGSDQAYENVNRKHGYAPEAVGLPEVLSDAVLEQLAKSKRFLPVDRKALRTAVLEQRFGKQLSKSYMDRTLDKAIQDLDKLEVGSGLAMPAVTSGAKYNTMLNDFRDLGTAIGARYMVLGNLHQMGSEVKSQTIPHSDSGKSVAKKTAEARMRLRVIDTTTSTIIGADSLHLEVSALLFEGGKECSRDDFEFMDQVAADAANLILDLVFPAKIVSLDPLIVSRGSNDGVVPDDYFTIIREGKEIKEASGETIARLKTPVGSVKVLSAQETISIVTVEEGEGFSEGDLAVRAAHSQEATVQKQGVPLKKQENEPSKGLPRIAVGLVKEGSTAKTGSEANDHVVLFTDTIITRLVQSKRFIVIDRQEVDQLLDEQMAQALVENRDMSSVMGTLKGCDYLVIGSLQNLSIDKKSIKLPNSSRIMEMFDGLAEGNMRIVDARSGDIMESRKISVEEQLDMQVGKDRLTAAIADGYAEQVVANLLNAVYPIKIAAISPDDKVYVNRGSDGLLKDETLLDVMREGEKVIDPDTGVELGAMETKIAQIELISVQENRSIGQIVEGSDVQSGDLLRIMSDGEGGAKSQVKRSGGTLAVGGATKPKQEQVTSSGTGKVTLALMKINLNARKEFKNPSWISALQEGTMDQISDNLVDALSKTNRFNMMERREIDQILDEKFFQAASQGGDIREYLKELEGADYIVVGEITNFYCEIRKRKNPYLDEIDVSTTGFIEGNQRIVDSHTSNVVATEKVRIKRKFSNVGFEESRTKLIDEYVKKAADGIIQRIYPMKILGVLQDGTIFINRGSDGGLKVGTTFNVERPGQELKDPDTGISFGTADTVIGKLEITVVEEARSRALMLSGESPARGDHIRNARSPAKPAKKKMQVDW